MNARILLIDDDQNVLDVLREHCRAMGHDTIMAPSGDDALRILNQEHVDLVVTDIRMPGISGEDVVRHIKKTPSLESIPVLVVTGNADIGTISRCIEIGAEDVLPKPFESPILQARISASLERAELRVLAMRSRELQIREQVGHEMVGAICHNFNQPLTVALANLQMVESSLRLLCRHCESVHRQMDDACNCRIEEMSAEFFQTSGKSMNRLGLFQGMGESVDSAKSSFERISCLVNEVKGLVRPESERYINEDEIINFVESKRHTILIAEDDPNLLALYAKRFKVEGYRVITAADGKETERHARFSSPHLAVIDIHMPHMDGIREVFRLRHLGELSFPVIVFSADASPSSNVLIKEHLQSVDAFIQKASPDAMNTLLDCCMKLLQNSCRHIHAASR